MTDGPLGVRVGRATLFPAGPALAASFDPKLVNRVGAALGREAKAHGKNVLLGPCVNIHRTPLGGRNFESYGEDPYLAARTTVAYIKGVQSEGVAATVKHFAVNNQETERMAISVAIDERALHEIYLPSFEAAVQEAKVLAVMCSYNRINGVYACENPTLLDEILEKQWGFRGLVMSDWGAVHSVVPTLKAGLHLEMPKAEYLTPAAVAKALDEKAIAKDTVDEMVRRRLRVLGRARRAWNDANGHARGRGRRCRKPRQPRTEPEGGAAGSCCSRTRRISFPYAATRSSASPSSARAPSSSTGAEDRPT